MAGLAPGIEEMNSLQEAGFTPSEIDDWRNQTTQDLTDAGFSNDEIQNYFGEKTPDMAKTEEYFKTNLATKRAAQSGQASGNAPAPTGKEGELIQPEKPNMKEADSFLEAIEAGFDMSVTGLIRERPDVVLPENAPMFYRIASQVATLAGDVPAMITGAVAGGAAGAAVGTATLPVVGTVGFGAVGAGAGAFALPEGMRTALMEHYEKGDVKSFSDFWERASAVAINTLKGGVIGGATAGVGGVVGKVAVKAGASAAVKTTAQLTSEVLTMTTVGSALEGKVPEPHEILDAAVLVGGLRGATKAASKIRGLYAKKGVPPTEIAERVQSDPKLKQQLLSENVEVPVNPEFGPKVEVKPPESIPTVKPLKENPNLSPEVNKILEKVQGKSEQPGKVEKTVEAIKDVSVDKAYTAFVDKLDPINQVTKVLTNAKELPAESNPYILARTAVDAPAKAKHMFEKGTIDFNTKEVNGKSLKSTLENVESVETLEAYMISKRVLEKNAQGKQTGFDVETARKVVEQNQAKYEAAAKEVTDFSNRVLDYVQQSGVVSAEAAARMKAANKDYVPFKRIIEESDKPGSKKGGGKAGSLKEFKGSERDIQSPIMSIVENTVELVKMAEQNRPKQALVKLIEQAPEQEIFVEVKKAVQEVKVSKEEVAKQLGISVEAAETVSTFRAMNKDLAPNQFAVFIEGKRKVFETTPEIAEALNKLGGDATSTNLFFKIANGITTVKKFGITFTPDFIIRNLFRDTLTASTFSKSKGMSPLDIVSAMGDIWKKNNTYYEWLKSGGANGAFINMGERYVKTDIYKLQRETNFMNSVRNLVEKPVDAMRVAAELSEQALRVAEFKKVRKAGGSLTEGGFASREITIDFQRVGAKMSALNSITAFMNVSIQGLDRSARAFKENPTAVATKSMAYITVPSVLLWWANHDDPRYQEIPRWEKDLFWIIPTDNWQEANADEAAGLPEYMVKEKGGKIYVNKGTIYRFPKPQELGILFGSLPERTLDAFFSENPGAFKNFEETMLNLVTPSVVPDAVAPAIEQYFNKSFFTGRDIVPHHVKDAIPEYEFVEYTSETAKTLGKMISTVDKYTFDSRPGIASPMVIENYINSWGGSLGRYAVQLSDEALKKAGIGENRIKPTKTLSDIPFIKSFVVRYPQAGSQSVQDFYDKSTRAREVVATYEMLNDTQRFDEAERFLNQNYTEFMIGKMAVGLAQGLNNQGKMIQNILYMDDYTADEKRQQIDGLYLDMINHAQAGLQMMRDFEKDQKQGE